MDKSDVNQLNFSQSNKKPWKKPELKLLSKGYSVNGGPNNSLIEQNYTMSYFTKATPAARQVIKGPSHGRIIPHNGNRSNYHS